jgi:hypothetical protein
VRHPFELDERVPFVVHAAQNVSHPIAVIGEAVTSVLDHHNCYERLTCETFSIVIP